MSTEENRPPSKESSLRSSSDPVTTTQSGTNLSTMTTNKSESSTSVGSDCGTCVTTAGARTPANMWSPAIYKLSKGEFLHDRIGPNQSMRTLESFVKSIAVQNTYRIFFNYTTVLQRDAKRCTTSFRAHPDLNRYSDIPCFEDNRIKSPHPDGHDYIHASYIDGYRTKNKYILAQAPLNQTLAQWWNLIWQEKIVIIVSMQELDEANCPRYIPMKTGQKLTFDKYTIEHSGTACVRGQYDATNIHVTNGKDTRHLLHFVFHGWPNKGSPTRPTELLNFLTDINMNYDILIDEAEGLGWLTKDDKSPWLLHCRTGVGRSATVVAVDICCRKLDDTLDMGPLVDVEDCVLKLRTQRAMAIQKPEQYLYLHLIMLEYSIRRHLFSEVDEINVANFKINTDNS